MSTQKRIYTVVIECDEESSDFVQTLKDLRSYGFNTAFKLAEALNECGAPLPPNAAAWAPETVRNVLKKLKLIGLDNGKLRPADGRFDHPRQSRAKVSKSKADKTVYVTL